MSINNRNESIILTGLDETLAIIDPNPRIYAPSFRQIVQTVSANLQSDIRYETH